MATREQHLREGFERVTDEQSFGQAERDRWQQDRLTAEQVIRDLVQQLEVSLAEIAKLQSTSIQQDGTVSAARAA